MAAIQHIWISGTGVYSNDASWNTDQTPGDGGGSVDTAIFDGTSQHDVIGETPGGNALFRIVSRPEYKGNIASSGNPLIVQLASEATIGSRCVFRSRGNIYYAPPLGTLADVVVDTGTQDRVVQLSNNLQHVFVKSGRVEFAGGGGISSLTVLGPNSYVTLLTPDMTLGPLRLISGVVSSNQNNWASIEMRGGHMIEKGYLDDDCDLVMYGGWFEYAATAAISTHNPDIYLYGGTLDLRKLKEDLTATDLVIGPGATVLGNIQGQGSGIGADVLQVDLRLDYP